MSFSGYAVPFVGVAPDLRSRLERSKQLIPILVGILLGGIALALLCASLLVIFKSLNILLVPNKLMVVLILLFLLGDIWAMYHRSLYPLSPKRQARQSLEVAFNNTRIAPLIWGVDAGFSAATYRVTSGLWVVLTLLLFNYFSPWYLILYSVGFAIAFWSWSLFAYANVVTRSNNSDPIDLLIKHRTSVQLTYVAFSIFGIISASI